MAILGVWKQQDGSVLSVDTGKKVKVAIERDAMMTLRKTSEGWASTWLMKEPSGP